MSSFAIIFTGSIPSFNIKQFRVVYIKLMLAFPDTDLKEQKDKQMLLLRRRVLLSSLTDSE